MKQFKKRKLSTLFSKSGYTLNIFCFCYTHLLLESRRSLNVILVIQLSDIKRVGSGWCSLTQTQ